MILELLQLNVGILVAVKRVAAPLQSEGESARQLGGQVGLPVEQRLCFVNAILRRLACLVG